MPLFQPKYADIIYHDIEKQFTRLITMPILSHSTHQLEYFAILHLQIATFLIKTCNTCNTTVQNIGKYKYCSQSIKYQYSLLSIEYQSRVNQRYLSGSIYLLDTLANIRISIFYIRISIFFAINRISLQGRSVLSWIYLSAGTPG